MSAAPAEPVKVPEVEHVPVKMLYKGDVVEFMVPVDDEYNDCRRAVIEANVEEARERAKTRTDADKLREASAKPFADALCAAIQDCEQQLAQMQKPDDTEGSSELFRLSALIGADYDHWRSEQTPPDAGKKAKAVPVAADSKVEADEEGGKEKSALAKEDEKAPIYVARIARKFDAETKESEPWGAPQILNLRANGMERLLPADEVKALASLKMHKYSHRALLLERSYMTPDGPIVLSFAVIFAVRGDLRADIAARRGSPMSAIPNERQIVLLRTFINCTIPFDTTGYKNKAEWTKAAALRETRANQGRVLYEADRLRARQECFSNSIPGLVSATIGALARQLSPLYDVAGIKVPDEAIIIKLDSHEGVIVFDDTQIFRHTQWRALRQQIAADLKVLEEELKPIGAAFSAAKEAADGKAVWNLGGERVDKQKKEDVDRLAEVTERQRVKRGEYTQLLNEYKIFAETDQLASNCNTRNEIVFCITDTASGLDASNALGARFPRRINVYSLIKRTELALKREAEAATAAAAAVSSNQTEAPRGAELASRASEPPAQSKTDEPPAQSKADEPPVQSKADEPTSEVESPAPSKADEPASEVGAA